VAFFYSVRCARKAIDFIQDIADFASFFPQKVPETEYQYIKSISYTATSFLYGVNISNKIKATCKVKA